MTRPEHLHAVLRAVKDAPVPPADIQRLPPAVCHLQALNQPPGLGQPGTETWQWQGWFFSLPCPPFGEDALVTLLLALPPSEVLSSDRAFQLWQLLLTIELHLLSHA